MYLVVGVLKETLSKVNYLINFILEYTKSREIHTSIKIQVEN